MKAGGIITIVLLRRSVCFTLQRGRSWRGEALLKLGSPLTLKHVYLAKHARGQGDGGKLLRAVCRWLDRHHTGCTLYARSYDGGKMTDGNLIAWYRRHGWKPAGKGDMRRPARKPVISNQ